MYLCGYVSPPPVPYITLLEKYPKEKMFSKLYCLVLALNMVGGTEAMTKVKSTQCGNLKNFLPLLRFHMKVILENSSLPNLHRKKN